MPTTLPVIDHDQEELLYQAAVDQEFRDVLSANPERFMLSRTVLVLPSSVQQQDQGFVDSLHEDLESMDIFACVTSCSSGPFTFVCDGSTKPG